MMGVYTGDSTRTKPTHRAVEQAEVRGEPPERSKRVVGLGALTSAFLSGTSAHGLPRLVSEKSLVRKLAWLVIFCGATGVFSFLMYDTFLTYFSHPVEINVDYLVRTEGEFPAVTVCNLNPLKKSTLPGSDYSALFDIDRTYLMMIRQNGQHSSSSESSSSSMAGKPMSETRQSEVNSALTGASSDFALKNSDFIKNAASDHDFESFMSYSQTDDYSDLTDLLKPSMADLDNYGHAAHDLILQCSFDKTNCSHLDFTKVYNSRYGNCFVFNMQGATTTLYGSRYGLRLTLNVEPDDYLGLYSHEVGARIAVHPANVTGFPEDEGVNAGSGISTSIGVTASAFTRLPAPYKTDCADGSNHTLLDSREYTVWACGLACLQNNLRRECGCLDRVGLSATEVKCSLTNATQEVCRQGIYNLYNKGQLGCYCPLPCNQVRYNTKVSTSTWPSNPYIPIMWSNIGTQLRQLGYDSVGDAKMALARVHVYLEDLVIQNTEEYAAFTEENILANMGGYLGLFVGISACTLMEFFEYILDACAYVIIACGGNVTDRLEQRKGKGAWLPTNKTYVETVRLPPDPRPPGTRKAKVISVDAAHDVVGVEIGFNPSRPSQW